MKQIIKSSIFLLMAFILPTIANAHDFEVDGIYYNINGNEAYVTYNEFNEYSGSVTIPSTVTYGGTTYSVTSIGEWAFSGCSGLTSINIPNSVSSIGMLAFSGCSGLTSINIPNSVTSFDSGAFYGCSRLTSINISNSVTSIGNDAFYGCSGLTSIDIPNSVSSIGYQVFYECSGLTSVNIGNSVTYIGERAFFGCTRLTSINIPNSVTSIDNQAFYGCTGLTNIDIPNSVTSIGNKAFYGCTGLTSIDIPNSVTSIGEWAFYECSGLTSINIPNSVTSIGSATFYGCSGLTSINIPNSVTSIGMLAFSGCYGLTSIIIPNSVTSIGSSAFYGCTGLTSIDISNSVTHIGESAFSGCTALTSIDIPNSVTSIGEWAFYECFGLTSINIPNSVTSIGSATFYGCSGLTSINIPNSVTSIDNQAFYGCTGLTSIDIPNSVTSIGNQAFYGCPELTSVNIGNSVTSIGNQAFCDCPNIAKVTSLNVTPPTFVDLTTFNNNVFNHANLYVPKESVSKYKASASWGQFIHIIGISTSNDIIAEKIILNHRLVNMGVGATSQLVATVLPDSTTDKTVLWTVDNEEVATVDSTGCVTAIASGTATITALTTDGSNLSASCTVVVYDDLSQYDNYLSLNDAEAFHGDTIVIPVRMTNSDNFIAFQTDIILPEGLELLQEDGEYIIDPSDRMTRTHSILSNDVSGGAIRVICYSSNYRPFTGESGDDLFYITIKIADDAEGDYTIQLKNTLLTNTDFIDIAAPDVAANVYVKAYLLGDANGSGSVSVTDVVVTAQYILEMNPTPFIFEAADVNVDEYITVADVARIAWMVLNPTQNVPRRMPMLTTCSDRMSGEDVTLMPGETRRVSILLDNAMEYSAFQFDMTLPVGLTASNFQLTDRASSHAFDVNTLSNGRTRALCYSPALATIDGHKGDLLTFDVTATAPVDGNIIVDGIELVTADCQTALLDAFSIGVNSTTSLNELNNAKAIARVDYYNLAGQQIDHPDSGVTLVVTTYTDGTRTTAKVIQ